MARPGHVLGLLDARSCGMLLDEGSNSRDVVPYLRVSWKIRLIVSFPPSSPPVSNAVEDPN